MLLTFCINEMEVHVKRDVERLLYINAAQVVALQMEPATTSPEGLSLIRGAAFDVVIHTGNHRFRVPFVGRNLTAVSAWQVYVEGQK